MFVIRSFGRLAQSSHDFEIPKTRQTALAGEHDYVPVEEHVRRPAAVEGLLPNGGVLPVQDQAHVRHVLLQRREAQRLRAGRTSQRPRARQHPVRRARGPTSGRVQERLQRQLLALGTPVADIGHHVFSARRRSSGGNDDHVPTTQHTTERDVLRR